MIPSFEDYLKHLKHTIMIVPHIIPCEVQTLDQFTPVNYQLPINLDDLEHGFLLTGIHSHYPIQHLRIRKGTTMYFSAPGWFIYEFHDHKIDPGLFFQPKDNGWYLDVLHCKPTGQYDIKPKHLEFALIGQRVVPIS